MDGMAACRLVHRLWWQPRILKTACSCRTPPLATLRPLTGVTNPEENSPAKKTLGEGLINLEKSTLVKYSGEELTNLVRASCHANPDIVTEEQKVALRHLAKLCTADRVSKWERGTVFELTKEIVTRKVGVHHCRPLVARCQELLETSLMKADSGWMTASADIFRQVKAEDGVSTRMLQVISTWTELESAHLSLQSLLSILGNCLLAGMKTPLLQLIVDGFKIENATDEPRFTLEMLYEVPPATVSLFCQGLLSVRYHAPDIPLAAYLMQLLRREDSIYRIRDVSHILEYCNRLTIFPSEFLPEFSTLMEELISNAPSGTISRLVGALDSKRSRTAASMKSLQKKAVETATELCLESSYSAYLLLHTCSRLLDVDDSVISSLVKSALDSEGQDSLSNIGHVLRALSFRYGSNVPEELLRRTWLSLDVEEVSMENFCSGVECVTGMASMKHSHGVFLKEIAEFTTNNLDALLQAGHVRYVAQLAIGLAKLQFLHKDLAWKLQSIANSLLSDSVDKHSRERSRRALVKKEECDALLPVRQARLYLPEAEILRLLAYCTLHRIFPLPAFLILGKLRHSDVKNFKRYDVERLCVWALAPVLYYETRGKMSVDPAIQNRFLNWTKAEVWPVNEAFLSTVYDTLLGLCRNDQSCIACTLGGANGVRLHFGLVLSRMGHAPNSWKELGVDPVRDGAGKVPHSMERVGILCVDSSKDTKNVVQLSARLIQIALSLARWRLVVVDQATWPDNEDCRGHLKELLRTSSTNRSVSSDEEWL